MFEYIEGNIFESPAQVIVNTVNTVGVMGKGIALEFKKRYPDMFIAYRAACEKHQLTTGKLMLWRAPDHWVLLFPTKQNWRNPSKIEYIEEGLFKFVSTYAEKNISSIAFPKLGCGNGELDWNDVRPIMEKYLKPLPIDVYIYLGPKNYIEPEHKRQKATMDWMKSYAKDLSFNGVKDDIIYNTRMLPYNFNIGDKEYSVKWNNGLVFNEISSDKQMQITEDSFFEIWDSLRKRSVFRNPSGQKGKELICAMLLSLGYLSEIRLQDSKTQIMYDGYQFNEGSGRVFALKGNA